MKFFHFPNSETYWFYHWVQLAQAVNFLQIIEATHQELLQAENYEELKCADLQTQLSVKLQAVLCDLQQKCAIGLEPSKSARDWISDDWSTSELSSEAWQAADRLPSEELFFGVMLNLALEKIDIACAAQAALIAWQKWHPTKTLKDLFSPPPTSQEVSSATQSADSSSEAETPQKIIERAPAIAYLRTTTDDEPLELQRKQIMEFSKDKYLITEWYVDTPRTRGSGYQRLMDDAMAGKFNKIVSVDSARFGRVNEAAIDKAVADRNRLKAKNVEMITIRASDVRLSGLF